MSLYNRNKINNEATFVKGEIVGLKPEFVNTSYGKIVATTLKSANIGTPTNPPYYVVDYVVGKTVYMVGVSGFGVMAENLFSISQPSTTSRTPETIKGSVEKVREDIDSINGVKYYVVVDNLLIQVTTDRNAAFTLGNNKVEQGHTVVVIKGVDAATTKTRSVLVSSN